MSWKIDPAHSQIQFSVRHMMISNVRGRFESFTGTVEFDEQNPSALSATIEVNAASITTNEAQRDAHLRSADFFAADEYPVVRFVSTGVEWKNAEHIAIHGELTIRDTTRPVTLDAVFAGVARSPWGTTSAGFSARTKLSRKEWNLTWNQVLETGGFLVGDDITLDIDVELVQESVAEAVTA